MKRMSEYRHFPSRAEEGAEAVVLPDGDYNRMGCFTDQVKLTRALVRDLDEAVKEVKLLGEHEEVSSQKIMELEAMCQKLREDTQRLEEEKAPLKEWSSLVMSCLWILLGRLDWTIWEKMMRMKRKRRMPMMERMPPHPLLLRHHLLRPLLPCMRRMTMKVQWR
jgi:hypothetical protein